MKKRRPRGRIAIFAIFLLGLLIFGAVYFAWSTATDIFQPVSTNQGKTITVVIQNGETTLQIANDLQAKGVIRNALAFRVWSIIKGLDTHLQAGAYNLNPNMTIDTIINQLLNAEPDYLVAAIPEGWRIQQMAQQFGAAGLIKFNVQDFLKYTKNPMLTEFTGKVQQNHLAALAKQKQLSLYQAVILASIVEREVIFNNDRSLVASVYWNRIYRPNNETVGLLDADPTVQYARDSQSGTTTFWKPLQNSGGNIVPNSLWNTYTHKGLPPTPICSPGLASMEAAASPASTDYYFFLSKKDGHNVYAKTKAEFDMDVQKYLQP